MNLDANFPRYTEHDPQVPVWWVTPERPACIHRFFDTSPISPSGRYLAVLQLPREDGQPQPGEAAQVVVVDLETGTDRVVAETCGWEPQMGANLNWGGSDHELYFNDVDTATWQPFAWKLDPLGGTRRRLGGTVYHASPDGRWLISANLTTSRRTQPGYGVMIPDDRVRTNPGLAQDDGFYLTDTHSGECRLLASIAELFARSDPPVRFDGIEDCEVYGFHSKFNPQGDWLMLSLRWFRHRDEPTFDMFRVRHSEVHFAWVTMPLDGSRVHCPVGPEEWRKGGHHATWFPDGERLSMNVNIREEGMRFVQARRDGHDYTEILTDVLGSGHPTIHRDGRHLVTDTYTHEPLAFGDGTIPLRWVDLRDGTETCAVRINTQQPCPDNALRVDPHPAWDPTWRYVTFNAFVGGTRHVFVADFAELLP